MVHIDVYLCVGSTVCTIRHLRVLLPPLRGPPPSRREAMVRIDVYLCVGSIVCGNALLARAPSTAPRSPSLPEGGYGLEAFSHPCEKYGRALSGAHIKATTTKPNVLQNLLFS